MNMFQRSSLGNRLVVRPVRPKQDKVMLVVVPQVRTSQTQRRQLLPLVLRSQCQTRQVVVLSISRIQRKATMMVLSKLSKTQNKTRQVVVPPLSPHQRNSNLVWTRTSLVVNKNSQSWSLARMKRCRLITINRSYSKPYLTSQFKRQLIANSRWSGTRDHTKIWSITHLARTKHSRASSISS